MQSQVHESAVLDGITYMSIVHVKLDFNALQCPNMVQACYSEG